MDPRNPIPGEWIDAALAADAEWMRKARAVVFVSPARDQVRAMLEAAAPLIAQYATAAAVAKLDELQQTVQTYVRVRGEHAEVGDLAEGLRQIFDRKSGDEGEGRG